MELGEKLLQARLEAGLSQRQLCGDTITRNMLSQIEHGTAKPSMGTLQYLAARLGKPVSYFLEDTLLPSGGAVLEELASLQKAREALSQGKHRYAEALLEKVTGEGLPEMKRQKLLLLARMPGGDLRGICKQLPSLDEELLLRAQAAMEDNQWSRSLHLLEAMEDHTAPQWSYLRGQLWLQQKDYVRAAECFHNAEDAYPETYPLLEQCYRELEDFRQAYHYAVKQKK